MNSHETLNLQEMPILGRIIRRLDGSVGNYGLPKTVKELFARFNGNITPEYDTDQVQSILNNDPVLVVATHPTASSAAAVIAALPETRSDMQIIALAENMGYGENIRNYILPIWGVMHQKKEGFAPWAFKQVVRRLGYPIISRAEASERNAQTLHQAAENLDNGGVVVLFPERNRKDSSHWAKGVGGILKQLNNPAVKIVFCNVEGSSPYDIFRVPLSLVRPKRWELRPRFSDPMSVPVAIGESSVSPADIASLLESKYKEWAKSK